jgi:uncharacterized membrane protein YfcA
LLLVLIGAVASGINSVAGGGSLISFPALNLGFNIPTLEANATNSVGLWPGSLSGAWGFRKVLGATQGYLKLLGPPTLLGSSFGAWLLTVTDKKVFEFVVPILLFVATLLLWLQPKIKRLVLREGKVIAPSTAVVLQLIVSAYGGYFGAGMGIMMLAVFALFMDANIHEINAVKTILGVVINLTASILFLTKGIASPASETPHLQLGLVYVVPAVALTVGSLIGGYYAAKWSQKVDPDRLRVGIAVFGAVMSASFAWRVWH